MVPGCSTREVVRLLTASANTPRSCVEHEMLHCRPVARQCIEASLGKHAQVHALSTSAMAR
eukprot:5472753-Amphidinium_carterae.1